MKHVVTMEQFRRVVDVQYHNGWMSVYVDGYPAPLRFDADEHPTVQLGDMVKIKFEISRVDNPDRRDYAPVIDIEVARRRRAG